MTARKPALVCFRSLCQFGLMDMQEIMMIIGDDEPEAISVRGEVILWRAEPPAKGSWYFMMINAGAASRIRAGAAGRSGGWGSVRVAATLGKTQWQTSLFPNKQSGGFMLPLKADVRRAEAVSEGDEIEVMLVV